MYPSTKCGQSGSEGLRLAFFCSLLLRLRLYSAFVLPVLTYNMGTWGLTKTELSRLDAHHRRHLRQIIGIRWPHRISNDALYRRTHSSPISAAIRAARLSLFGPVLRLPLDAPVQRAIVFFFSMDIISPDLDSFRAAAVGVGSDKSYSL